MGLVRFAVETMKKGDCNKFLAHVQPQNVRFFIRLGWKPIGEDEIYQGLPHQLMEADLGLGADRSTQYDRGGGSE